METWDMPVPRAGDIVLFSPDPKNFDNATIGFCYKRPGSSTIDILVFTPTGWVDRRSVHHRDDPGWIEAKHWNDDGAWDFAPITKDIQKAVTAATAKERMNVNSK
jgi:hypothetical protein